jgi:hypothetical protein
MKLIKNASSGSTTCALVCAGMNKFISSPLVLVATFFRLLILLISSLSMKPRHWETTRRPTHSQTQARLIPRTPTSTTTTADANASE